MIFRKFWAAMKAQLNKLANVFWEADPIAQMRYEYDRAVEELKSGREGLEKFSGLVETVKRTVLNTEQQHARLLTQARAYLKAGDRTTAGKYALEANEVEKRLRTQREQLAVNEETYENCLKRIRHATGKINELKEKIHRYDAELQMSEAEAEFAKLAERFDVNGVGDIKQLEDAVQRRIDLNRGTAKAAADYTREGLADIESEEQLKEFEAEEALKALEAMDGEVVETSRASEPARARADD